MAYDPFEKYRGARPGSPADVQMKRLAHMMAYPDQYGTPGFKGFEVPPFTTDQALQARRDLEAEPWKEQPWQPPTQASYGVDGSWPIPYQGPPPIEPQFEGAVSGPWLEDQTWWSDEKSPRLHYTWPAGESLSHLAVDRLAHMEKYPWQYGMGERPQEPAPQMPQMPPAQQAGLQQQLEAMQFNQYPEMQARGPDESLPPNIAPQDYAQIRDMTAQAYAAPRSDEHIMAEMADMHTPLGEVQPLVNLGQEAGAVSDRYREAQAMMPDYSGSDPTQYPDYLGAYGLAQPAIPGGAQLGGQQGTPEEIWWQNYEALPDPAQGYLPNVNWEHPLSKHNMVDLPRRKQQEEFMAAFGQPPGAGGLPGGKSIAELQKEMGDRNYALYEERKGYEGEAQQQLEALYGPDSQSYQALAAIPGKLSDLSPEDQFLYRTTDLPDAPAGAQPAYGAGQASLPNIPRGDDRPFAYPDKPTPQEWAYLDTAVEGQQAKFTPDMAEAVEAMQLRARMAGVPIDITGPLSGARTPEEIAELQRRHALPPTDPEYSKWAADPTGRHTEAGGYTGVDFIVGDDPNSPQSQWLGEFGGEFGISAAYKKGVKDPHYHHYGWDRKKWMDNPYVDSTGEPAGSAGAPMAGGGGAVAPEMPPEAAAIPLSAQAGAPPADMGLDLAPIPGRMSELSGKDRLYAQLIGDPNVSMEEVEQLRGIAEAPLPSMLGNVEAGMAKERGLGLDRGDIIASPEASPGGGWPEGIMGEMGRTLAHQQFLDERMKPYELAGISPPAELASQIEAADRRAESVRKGAQQWDKGVRERVRRLRVIANQLSVDRGIGRRSEFTNQRTQDAEALFESLPNVETGRAAPQETLSKRGGLEPKRFREALASMDREITELTRNLPLDSSLRSELETLNRNMRGTPSPNERAPKEVARILETDAYPGEARSPRAKLGRFSDVYELNNILDRYEAWMDRIEAVSRKVKPRRSRSKRLARQARINISKRK